MRIFRHYVSRGLLLTLGSDAAIIIGVVALAESRLEWTGAGPIWPKAAAFTAIALICMYISDLYNAAMRHGRLELVLRVLVALTVSAILFAALAYAVPALRLGRLAFLEVVGGTTVGLLAMRLLMASLGASATLRTRVLVVGSDMSELVVAYEQEDGASPFTIVGFVDGDLAAHDRIPPGYDLLGKPEDLLGLVDDHQPDLVLIARSNMRGAVPIDEVLECRFRGVQVEDWPTFFEKRTGRIFVDGLRPSWLIFSDGFAKTRLTETVKRTLDVTVALMGLIIAAPLSALVAILIKLDSPGPVLFRQARVGKDGKVFTLNKFRSMRADAEATTGPVWASANDPRVTRLGRILRTTRIDEVPQLYNVLVGQMSLVGPRPERPEFVEHLRQQIPFYRQRFSVKPGLTGWAQVKYGYGSTVEHALTKLQFDLYYIKNVSLFLDLLILLATVQVVLFGRGAR